MEQIKERKITGYKVECEDHGMVDMQLQEVEAIKDYPKPVCPVCFKPANVHRIGYWKK